MKWTKLPQKNSILAIVANLNSKPGPFVHMVNDQCESVPFIPFKLLLVHVEWTFSLPSYSTDVEKWADGLSWAFNPEINSLPTLTEKVAEPIILLSFID